MGGTVLTIQAGAPFADTLARGLIARVGDDPLAMAGATIYLPTRRAGRTLAESFARVLGGAALLPSIRPLGDVDEDDLLFEAEDVSLMPAIAPIRRQFLLATLVQRWGKEQRGGAMGFAQAVALAHELARFLDDCERQGADLSKIETLAPEALAAHWADVRAFLLILRDHWPAILQAEGRMNRAAYSNASLAALARRLETKPPAGPVVAGGPPRRTSETDAL